MYGKFFASTYSGSMIGAGPVVFAVWPYAIACCDKTGVVELNPVLLAFILGTDEGSVRLAIDVLCRDDDASRTKTEKGRRLVREGEYLYRIVNFEHYRRIRDEDERREYNRIKQAEYRGRKTSSRKRPTPEASLTPGDSQQLSAMSAHTDTDADSEAEEDLILKTEEVIAKGGSRGANRPAGRAQPFPAVGQTFIASWQGPQIGIGQFHDVKAHEQRLDLKLEAERFRAHYQAKGEMRVDWDAQFTGWLLSGYGGGKRNGGGRRDVSEATRNVERQLERVRRLEAEEAAELANAKALPS